jgi:hypothetical protein
MNLALLGKGAVKANLVSGAKDINIFLEVERRVFHLGRHPANTQLGKVFLEGRFVWLL